MNSILEYLQRQNIEYPQAVAEPSSSRATASLQKQAVVAALAEPSGNLGVEHLWNLLKQHGDPQVLFDPSQSHYNPITGVVRAASGRALVHELEHRSQAERLTVPLMLGRGALEYILHGKDQQYAEQGTLENQADQAVLRQRVGLR